MPPKKGKIVDKRFFNALGKRVVKKYKDHIWNDQEDVYDHKFKDYSTYPSKWVMINLRKGERKGSPKEGYSYRQAKKGGKLKRQSSSSKSSKAPFLSGDFKNDFTLFGANDGGFQMGWRSHGGKVNWLKDMGRVVTARNQPMPKRIQKFILKRFHEKVEDHFPDNEVIRIRRRK